jgi:hypothetical protein
MIAGGGGVGKTTFNTFLMKCILERHSNVSVLWYVIDHESGKSINRKFMSTDLRLTDSQLRGVEYKLNESQRQAFMSLSQHYMSFDIEFCETPSSIVDISHHWSAFVDEKKGRKPILVIDNIMRVTEMKNPRHTNADDDFVANTIADMYKYHEEVEPLVIFLHHMNKDQISKFNLDQAYRPTIENIKGSGRIYDIAETVVLLNRPGAYDMLLNEFPNQKEFLQDMFIGDIVKNTRGSIGLVRFWVNIAYGIFEEIK